MSNNFISINLSNYSYEIMSFNSDIEYNIDKYKTTHLLFKYIPEGEFIMGSPEKQLNWYKNEKQHNVRITKGFYIGVFEVTQQQYLTITGNNPSHHNRNPLFPVDQLTWNDVMKENGIVDILSKNTKLNITLPTEAQWEYAARYNSKQYQDFAGSDNILDVAWCFANAKKTTHIVGTKLPNNYGLFDMCGNVYEWCLDFYKSDITMLNIDPYNTIDELKNNSHVMRGGCCSNYAFRNLTSSRRHDTADTRHLVLGIRLAINV